MSHFNNLCILVHSDVTFCLFSQMWKNLIAMKISWVRRLSQNDHRAEWLLFLRHLLTETCHNTDWGFGRRFMAQARGTQTIKMTVWDEKTR